MARAPGSLPEGAPDLVVEVVSRTSERKDRKIFPDLYAKAGTPEVVGDALGSKIRFAIFTLQGAPTVPSSPTTRAGSGHPASACASAFAASPTFWNPGHPHSSRVLAEQDQRESSLWTSECSGAWEFAQLPS